MLIQIFLILFFLFALAKVYGRYRSGELGRGGLIFWVVFWILAAVIVLLPDTTFYFARLAGVSRGADLVVYLALALLFFMAFRLSVRLEKISRDITKLTRTRALDEAKEEKKNVL